MSTLRLTDGLCDDLWPKNQLCGKMHIILNLILTIQVLILSQNLKSDSFTEKFLMLKGEFKS